MCNQWPQTKRTYMCNMNERVRILITMHLMVSRFAVSYCTIFVIHDDDGDDDCVKYVVDRILLRMQIDQTFHSQQ